MRPITLVTLLAAALYTGCSGMFEAQRTPSERERLGFPDSHRALLFIQSGRRRAQIMSHSIRVSSVRRSTPGANGGLAMVIRNRLLSISTLYLRGSPVISLGFL